MAYKGYETQKIVPVSLESEMRKSFIEYAMSVIIDRALPDVRDGLKPVHRRILYSMHTLGLTSDKPYRKCALSVGEVQGKYHPHGDLAVYDSLVRMAQPWSLRYCLVDGQGNFGSIDGDDPAAMRYTEARLHRLTNELMADIGKETVDFKANYDEREMEPVVLPSRYPNLLVNGSSGIAVGMATNIPTHNLSEVIDATVAVIDDPGIAADGLLRIMPGPDFPTGGIILGKRGIREYFETGKGRVIVRAVAAIEQEAGRQRIIVSELPYQVNKKSLIEKIAELVKNKVIDGISYLNDESGREDPVRIAIDVKREANANVVLNQLYRHTQMQDTFGVNMVAIIQGKDGKYEPETVNVRKAIGYYLEHQKDVVRRRTQFDLTKALARAHILEGLLKAIDMIDEVIRTIRGSESEAAARLNLMASYGFTEQQAQAIVDMRLGRLANLERERLQGEYKDLLEKIGYYQLILADEARLMGIIKDELTAIKARYGDARRTAIMADDGEIEDEDLIEEESCVITMTSFGYVKRLPAETYKQQRRGGRGVSGQSTREEDTVEEIYVTSSHARLMFFSNVGRVFALKAYEIPSSGRAAKGMAIVNVLSLMPGERITKMIPVVGYGGGRYLVTATKGGQIKKTALGRFSRVGRKGLTAVALKEGDELMDVRVTDGGGELMLTTRKGMCVRFHEADVRPLGRKSMGVRGIRVGQGDMVIAMEVLPGGADEPGPGEPDPDGPGSGESVTDEIGPDGKGAGGRQTAVFVTERGFGKRTDLAEFKRQRRGGTGLKGYKVTDRTGCLIGMRLVGDDDDMMIVNSEGIVIRIAAQDIRVLGRATQGVTLMRSSGGHSVVSMAVVGGGRDGMDGEAAGLARDGLDGEADGFDDPAAKYENAGDDEDDEDFGAVPGAGSGDDDDDLDDEDDGSDDEEDDDGPVDEYDV
ncbi:MAG: DNA gyrase subunit A [Oscillospiraceae bacterium]|nr:DNA gyrase subunit A [Oscillospiraceae bacterium]